METPSTLYLIVVASIGTALLSVFTVNESLVAVLIIPFALLAYYLHGRDAGIVVGVVSSVLAGLLVGRMENWDMVIYALASGIMVLGIDMVYPQSKHALHYLVFAAAGTIVFELLNDIYGGNGLLLRSENFLGTNPASGIRVLFNVVVTGLVLSFYSENEAKKEKK